LSTVDAVTDDRTAVQRQFARYCGIGMYVVSAAWGVLQIIFPANGTLYWVAGLMIALLATLWAAYDAKARNRPILPVLQMLYFLAWPIGATVYLVSRSGLKGILLACLHGLGMTALMVATFYITFYALRYAGLVPGQL
jgi:hypothetical protein